MHDVFISYSTKDLSQAEKVRDILENNGIPCWMAPRDIPGGSNYAREIPQAIRGCQVFVLILSDNAQRSTWVVKELDNAVNCGKVIMPLMLEDCPLNDEFNFLLTGAQRYAAYRKSAEVLNTLVERIRCITGRKPESVPAVPEKKTPAARETAVPPVHTAKPEKPRQEKKTAPVTLKKAEILAFLAVPGMALLSLGGYLLGSYVYASVRNQSFNLSAQDHAVCGFYVLLGALTGAALWWEWIRFRHRELAECCAAPVCPACGSDRLNVSTFLTRWMTRKEAVRLLAVPLCGLAGWVSRFLLDPLMCVLLDTYFIQVATKTAMAYAGTFLGLAVGLWLSNALVRRLRRNAGLSGAVCRCCDCRTAFLPVTTLR